MWDVKISSDEQRGDYKKSSGSEEAKSISSHEKRNELKTQWESHTGGWRRVKRERKRGDSEMDSKREAQKQET